MKISNLILSSALAATAMSASAGQINTIDLTGVVGLLNGDVVTGVNFGDVTGGATVIQDLGGDGVLSAGDTFTESGRLEVTDWKIDPLTSASSGLGTDYELHFTFTDLAGAVTSVAGDLSFEFAFTPGVGSISLTADNTLDGQVTGGAITLATLVVLAGDGNFDTGGIALPNNGDNNLILGFTSALTGVFLDASGNDIADGILGGTSIAIGNLDNTLFSIDSTSVPGEQTVVVSTNGIVSMQVPEPAPLALMGLGILGLAFARKRSQA